MKKVITLISLLIAFNFCNAQSYNEKHDDNGFSIGMSAGVANTTPLLNLELAVKKDDVIFAFDYNRTLSTKLPGFIDLRLVYSRFMLQPYAGAGYQFYSNESDALKLQEGLPLDKFNLVYGLRFQYRKFIVSGGFQGSYKIFTIGFFGKLP